MRTADAHALARFDLGAKVGDRPVAPVGHRFFQQGVTTRKAASLFTGGGPGAMLVFSAATPPVAAPQANRIFAHAKRLRDPGAGPTSQRQKHGARPVRLAAVT